MKFDWTISLGSLIQLIVLIAALWRVSIVLARKFAVMENQISELMSMKAVVEECRQATGQLIVKMDALWDWFTNRLERRHETTK